MLFKIPGETFEQKLKLCCVQMLKHLSQPLESGVVKGMLEKKKKEGIVMSWEDRNDDNELTFSVIDGILA